MKSINNVSIIIIIIIIKLKLFSKISEQWVKIEEDIWFLSSKINNNSNLFKDSVSTEWVAGTVNAIKSYCLTRISKYEKFYVSNSSEERSVMEIFNAMTCINNCSKHGQCTDKGN